MLRRHFSTLLKIFISVGLIAFVFTRVHLPDIGAKLATADLRLVLAGLVCYLVAMTVNALKWWVLLRSQEIAIPFGALLEYTFVGFFFNNILPANIGGDVMRGWGLARHTQRTAVAAASVIIDRLIGLMAYMGVAVVSAYIVVVQQGRSDLRPLLWLALIVVAGLAAGLAVLLSRRLREGVDILVARTFLRPLAPRWQSLAQAFAAYRFRYTALALALLIGLAGLALTTLVNYLFSESLGGGISLLHVFLFNPLIALALIVPISVGGLGVNQAIYPFFFGLVGTPTEHSVSLSLFMQATAILTSLPGGLLWLRWRRRVEDRESDDHASHRNHH